MALVEAVAGEGRNLLPEGRCLPAAQPAGAAAVAELGGDGLHLRRGELRHPSPQVVGLRPAQAGNLPRQAQDLLLEEKHALCRRQDGLKCRVQVGDCFVPAVAADEGRSHTAGSRAGLEKGIGHRQVGDAACL